MKMLVVSALLSGLVTIPAAATPENCGQTFVAAVGLEEYPAPPTVICSYEIPAGRWAVTANWSGPSSSFATPTYGRVEIAVVSNDRSAWGAAQCELDGPRRTWCITRQEGLSEWWTSQSNQPPWDSISLRFVSSQPLTVMFSVGEQPIAPSMHMIHGDFWSRASIVR